MNKIITMLMLLAGILPANGQVDPAHFIDSVAAKYLAENHGLALIIGINIDGTERIFSYGETERGSKVHPDASSLFEIGQVTQVFTSALYARMSISGVINPDLPISSILPVDVPSPVYQEIVCEPVEPKDYRMEKGTGLNPVYTAYVCKPDQSSHPQPILICYLGTQTSGLPKKPGNMKGSKKDPYSAYGKEDLYDFLRGYTLSKPIGYDYRYSDLNMAVLGHILELKSGKGFESLLDSMVLSAVDMRGTGMTFDETMKKNLLNGHTSRGKIAPYWHSGIMAPAVGLHSNMNDMMQFLTLNNTRESGDLKDLFDYMHNPRIRFTTKETGLTEAGLGWLISPLKGSEKRYVWQEGLTGGFASFIGFVETTHTGIVILSNSAIPVKEMGEEILGELNRFQQ